MAAVHRRTHSDFGTPEDFPAVQLDGCDAPPGRLAEVRELVAKGNRAFRDNRVEKAINYYSKALVLKPGDHLILSNRSTAFSRISRLLRSRSASESEYQPLNGLDPTTHAELALKDAEKILQRNSVKSYFLKADALVLLERYEEAKETLLSGLHIDPLSNPLQNALRDLEKVLGDSNKRPKHEKLQRSDDFECTLCFKLLYEPVTTPCGHSFCRTCLLQSLDHGNKCPMCRTILFISPRTYPISVTLSNIIQKNFPEEYAERKAEHASVTNIGVDILPLFVLDVVLPCQKLTLNIFEPRYRLMVRRIMEGNRRMGMVAYDSTTGHIADFACEVEITECEPIPDGRFYLEVIGRRRFRILRCRDQDGYRVAEVEWIEDSHLPEGSPEKEDLKKMVYGAADMVQNLNGPSSEAAWTDRRSLRLAQAEGMPSPRDPELFSFWLFNLLTLRPQERLELLRLTDTRERISRALIYLRPKNQGSGSNDKLRCQT